ncbi:MAG TPA: hypothetical protein ENN67_05135 [Firmicutes bacterium]|nr:hypothetical protein [Bacillota bacterium]
MNRPTLIAILAVMILLALSCVEKQDETDLGPRGEVENETVTLPQDETGEQSDEKDLAGTLTPTGLPLPPNVVTDDEKIQYAMELLQQGDDINAVIILEGIWSSAPERDDLPALLVQAHTQYVRRISTMRGIDMEILNEVLYSHLQRILEFEPDNAEAAAGLSSVQMFYENRGLTLPAEINPLAFLPGEVPSGGTGQEAPKGAITLSGD